MDDRLIQVQATAIRASCAQLSAPQLQALQHSVKQACQLPRSGWALKAAAHAEIFGLLADTADNPVLVRALSSGAGLAEHLMMTVGPAAAGMTASSRQRLLTYLRAGDAEGAAHEMESYLRVLSFMGFVVAVGDGRSVTGESLLARANEPDKGQNARCYWLKPS